MSIFKSTNSEGLSEKYSNGNQTQGELPKAEPVYDNSMYDSTDSYQNREAHTFEQAMDEDNLSDGPYSPETIARDIKSTLSVSPLFDPEEIEIFVHHGVVTLTGTVSEQKLKDMATEIAYECAGVQEVKNDLRIIAGIDSPVVAKDFATLNKGTEPRVKDVNP